MSAQLAIIPSLGALGPLALLALLAPAVFAGLMLWMKRWKSAMAAASLMITAVLLRGWWQSALKPSWWSTRSGLWLALGVIAGLCALWAFRRFARLPSDDPGRQTPTIGDARFLGLVAAGTAGPWFAFGESIPKSLSLSLIVTALSAAAGLLYVQYLRRNSMTIRRSVESVVLVVMAGSCAGIAVLEPYLAGISASVRVDWSFEPGDGGAFLAEPWVDNEYILVSAAHQQGFDRWGAVYAVDRWTGRELWRFTNDNAMKPSCSSPRVVDGKVYVGEGLHDDSNCKLYCLDAATGKKIWEYQSTSHIESSPLNYGKNVIFGAGEDGLRSIDLETGVERWKLAGLHIDSSPMISAGLLFIGSYSGRGTRAANQSLMSLDAATGRLIWEEPMDLSCYNPPTTMNRRVFFGIGTGDFDSGGPDPTGAVVALDAITGQWVWRSDFADSVLASPVTLGDNVIAISRNGTVRSINRDTGKTRWSVDTGSTMTARPQLLLERGRGPSILAVTKSGRCIRLEGRTGKIFGDDDIVRAVGGDSGTFISAPVAARSTVGRQIFVAGSITQGISEKPRLLCLMDVE